MSSLLQFKIDSEYDENVPRALLLLLVMHLSCINSEELVLPDERYAIAFLYVARGPEIVPAVRPFRMSGEPFRGSFSRGDEDRLLLFGVDEATLRAFPFVDLEHPDTISLDFRVDDSCADYQGEVLADSYEQRMELPEFDLWVRAADDSSFVRTSQEEQGLGAVSIKVPLTDCPARVFLSPFSTSPTVLTEGMTILGLPRGWSEPWTRMQYYHFSDLIRLDADHLIAATPSLIYLFRRGDPFSDRPDQRFDFHSQLPIAPTKVFTINDGILASQTEDSATVVYALATPSGEHGGIILSVRIDHYTGNATATYTRTSSVYDARFQDIDVGPEGHLIATGSSGWVVTATSIASPLSVTDFGKHFSAASAISGQRFLLGTVLGQLQLGRLRGEELVTELLRGGIDQVKSIGANDDTPAIAFVGYHNGWIRQWSEDRGISRVPISLRPGVGWSCASYETDECLGLTFSESIRNLAADPRPGKNGVFVRSEHCASLVYFNLDTGCATEIAWPEADPDVDFFTTFGVNRRYLTVGGSRGDLYQLDLEEALP